MDNYNEELNRISQKLFKKNHNEIKWLMITNYVHKQLVEYEDCLRTGLYSWIPTFKGEVRNFKDVDPSEYKNYDIIQVNLSGQDVTIVGDIKEQLRKEGNTHTKVVANNDYTLELWGASFDHPSMFRREVNHADMVFGTEFNQVGTLEVLLGRKVHLIVHPCFTKRLKTLKPRKKADSIAVISHRYDNNNIYPSLAIKDLGYKTKLLGYEKNSDRKSFVTTTLYNECSDATNYNDFCEQLMDCAVVVDPFTFTSQGRVGWDCAAMGVPFVGSDRNYSSLKCFPKTCVSPYDIKAQREMVKKLLTDDKFRQEVIDYAKEAVEYVSYENSKLKYLRALEEGSPEIKV